MKKTFFIITMLFLLCSCTNEEIIDYRYTDYYEYMIDNYDNIEKIKMTTTTEGGKLCYDVTELKQELYNKIINIEIIKKSDFRTTDDDLVYTFIFNDNTSLNYSFEGTNYYYNKELYKINGYYKIPLNLIEDKEIECN